MVDLRDKIKKIIEYKMQNKEFEILGVDTVINKSIELINQLFNNYEIIYDLKQDFNNLPKQAELILLVAPTGAGKDSVVVKLNSQDSNKNYIELNIDMFRHYYPLFISKLNKLSDKNFAKLTNDFSYELYVTIQEIILQEFPGTNIIITGTLREISWVEETIKIYKNNKNTNYNIRIISLAVPKIESQISAIKRYISIVDDQLNNNPEFVPGTARYTSKKYHDETYEEFPDHLSYFENIYEQNPGKLIDVIEVYKRSKIINDYNEDTLVYSSKTPYNKTAVKAVEELRDKEVHFNINEIEMLIKIVKNNYNYLILQDTYGEILLIFANYILEEYRINEDFFIDKKYIIKELLDLLNIDNYNKNDDIKNRIEDLSNVLSQII